MTPNSTLRKFSASKPIRQKFSAVTGSLALAFRRSEVASCVAVLVGGGRCSTHSASATTAPTNRTRFMIARVWGALDRTAERGEPDRHTEPQSCVALQEGNSRPQPNPPDPLWGALTAKGEVFIFSTFLYFRETGP